ncbi:MAG: hypothetical protein EBS89_09850 [Proteobacteria bacterium]|nr:hypothetical protein [Pseudomonadota bacterium]
MFDWLKRCHQAAWARAFAKKPTPQAEPAIIVGGVTYPYRNLGAQKFECTVWLHDGSKREFSVDADSHVDASVKCETLVCKDIDRGQIRHVVVQLP